MTSRDSSQPIQIMGKKYQIKCTPEKAQDLQKAAHYLDSKMREIRDGNKASGSEQIALLAALNIAVELLTMQHQKDLYFDTMSHRIRDLYHKVDAALKLTENSAT